MAIWVPFPIPNGNEMVSTFDSETVSAPSSSILKIPSHDGHCLVKKGSLLSNERSPAETRFAFGESRAVPTVAPAVQFHCPPPIGEKGRDTTFLGLTNARELNSPSWCSEGGRR